MAILASSRIAAIILGELPIEHFFNEQRLFMLDLIQIRKYDPINIDLNIKPFLTMA